MLSTAPPFLSAHSENTWSELPHSPFQTSPPLPPRHISPSAKRTSTNCLERVLNAAPQPPPLPPLRKHQAPSSRAPWLVQLHRAPFLEHISPLPNMTAPTVWNTRLVLPLAAAPAAAATLTALRCCMGRALKEPTAEPPAAAAAVLVGVAVASGAAASGCVGAQEAMLHGLGMWQAMPGPDGTVLPMRMDQAWAILIPLCRPDPVLWAMSQC